MVILKIEFVNSVEVEGDQKFKIKIKEKKNEYLWIVKNIQTTAKSQVSQVISFKTFAT